MLTNLDYIYYTIYAICLALSFKARNASIPGLFYLRILLCFGLFIEVIVEVLQYLREDDNVPYYFYIPLEYYCLVQFYKLNAVSKRLKKFLSISVFVFFIAVIILAFLHYHFSGYPSIIYNISCFLNTIWISLLLFNFNMGNDKEIWLHPLFIVLSAFLIFFAGVFFFNPAYTYLLKKNPELAVDLREYTNVVLNYILYILLSYGFLCSGKNRK